MDRRSFVRSIGFATLTWPMAVRAETSRRPARLGIVSIGGPTADMTGPLPRNRTVRAFLRGMAELGYVFGRDFVTEARGTDALSTLPELVHRVDMVVATGGGTVLSSLKETTHTIPIIMTAAPDPVAQGYAQGLARPGGNFTGMSLQTLELTGKRLQILKELAPAAQVAAVFWDPTNPELWPAAQAFGQTQGWKMVSVEIRDSSEIEKAFKVALDAGVGAILVPASGVLFSRGSQIAQFAAQSRIPAIYELRPFVDAGGLASYGADIEDIWRRAATYVDKIIKGAHPAELPIEQPTKFELVINARAARALSLTLPPSILIRADDVID
ncbi:ABC transporter substrate-binding protein [Bradyrhizobium guangdongense]